MTLTKAHIIEAVSKQNGFTRKNSIETIETLLETVKSRLESGEDVLISGFGKFCIKDNKDRRGRSPSTRESIMLDSSRIVTFKVPPF